MNAIDQVVTPDYAIYQGDCCELIAALPDASIDFGIHSPPFEGLYKFSNSERDLSNNEGPAFWEHYAFLISELLRVTKPGRLHSVHVMQLPTLKIRHGHIGMRDFRGEVIRAYCGEENEATARALGAVLSEIDAIEEAGDVSGAEPLREIVRKLMDRREEAAAKAGKWILHSEVCIWKDPVVAQQRTKSIRLLHKQVEKDSTISGQGLADYILTFRKPGENVAAVEGKFTRFIGADLDVSDTAYARYAAIPPPDAGPNWKPWPLDMWRSVLIWQRYASPVWMDINQTRTLQYRAGRDERDEVHISPLQLDVIERCIDLWSLPGETVLTPFLGIGSEVYCAVEMGRKGIGFELKDTYFAQAKRNIAELYAARTDHLFEAEPAA